MSLLQELVNMQSQLQEAETEGELDLFIADQHKDLNRLLTAAISMTHTATELLNKLSEGEAINAKNNRIS
jgi:hypothetical protein